MNLDFNFTPNLKGHLTYVAVEENLTGSRRNLGFGRGDDWAVIASVEVTPIKGLDIRPIYSFFSATGSTPSQPRPQRGRRHRRHPELHARAPSAASAASACYEERHTIGVDARWRFGPFSLDPTFFYQFGTRDTDNPFGPADQLQRARGRHQRLLLRRDRRLADRAPAPRGPRHVHQRQPARRTSCSQDVNYYQPLNTDTGFYGAGWGEIFSLGIDYFIGCV